MSVGYGLIKSALSEGPEAFVLLLDRGITRESFQGDERAVFSSIEHFFLNYGTLPTLETVAVDSGITVPWDNFPIENILYWIDLVRERQLLLTAREHIAHAQDAIGRGNIDQLRDYIQQAYISLEEGINDHSVKSISDASRDAIDQHNILQQNSSTLSGVPFAFPYLNLISGGMSGGDLVCYAARPGLCKSYLLLNDAMFAHNAGKKVLFVSMEMPIIQCARRILSLRTRVNYTRLRLGRVSAFGIQRLEDEVTQMASQLPFQILSGGIFGTVDRIYAQIKHYRPDVVYIDGAYLVRTSTKGGQRWERVLQVLETLKKVALSENIPISITFQFNKTSPNALEGIAYCVSGSSIITTDSGLYRIQDKVGQHIKIYDGESFVDSTIVNRPRQEEWTIRTEYGQVWRGGANHKFKVWRGGLDLEWIKCKDLKTGDRIILFGIFDKGTEKDFVLPSLYDNRCFIQRPSKMSKELAEIVGLFIGDGSVLSDTIWTIAFDPKDRDTAEKIENYFWDLFKYQVELKQGGKNNAGLYIRLFTKSLIDFFRAIGIHAKQSGDKYIPYSILEAGEEIRGAFLRGLFDADGSISDPKYNKGSEIRLASSSKQLSNEVQLLLRTLGIDSLCSISTDVTKRKKMYLVRIYRSEIPTFYEKVGFLSKRKQNRLVYWLNNMPITKRRKGHLNWRNNKSELVKIEEVVQTGKTVNMYDAVTNGPNHTYLCDGIVTHNSDGVAQLSSIAIAIESEGTEDAGMARPIQYRTLKLLKGRDGQTGKIRIMLDFDSMQFSQESVLSGLSDNFEYEDNEIGSGLGNETDPEPVAFL